MLTEVPTDRERDSRATSVQMPSTWLMALASLIGLVIFASAESLGGAMVSFANAAMPVLLLVGGAVNALLIVRRDRVAIWSPVPWFLAACSLYFGIGALLGVYGDADSVEYSKSFYAFDDHALLRTNALNAVGVMVVCIAYTVAAKVLAKRVTRSTQRPTGEQTVRLMVLFAVVAIPVKYLLALPFTFGVLPFVLPGVVASLSMMTSLVSLLAWYITVAVSRRYAFFAIGFTALELTANALTFSKLEILLTVIMSFLGAYFASPSKRVVVIGAIVVGSVYAAATPFVANSRMMLADENDSGYVTRFRIVADYVANGPRDNYNLGSEDDDVNARWVRLSYSNAQAFAMDMYDAGRPGDTFNYLFYFFVPRFVWADKPLFDTGRRFTYLATGEDATATAPGVFAEAYWNGGWPLVVASMSYVGALFAWFTRMSIDRISVLDFRWLACGLFGIFIGLRPDDWFVATYFAGATIPILYYVAIRLLVRDASAEPVAA